MSLSDYLIPFLAAFLLTAAFTPLLRRYLVTRKIGLAIPRERDVHTRPLPKLGGVAVVASFLIVVVAILFTDPSRLSFVSETVAGIDRNLAGVLLGVLILLGTGIYDDLHDLKPGVKLGWQVLAALLVVAFGVKIHWLTNPLGGATIELGSWTYLIVPLWLLAMINVMNWFDGLDGLASGLSIIASIAIVFLSLEPFVAQPGTALLAAILAGAALGFLPYNWHPSRIILGDSGSMVLGFMLGVFAIISGAKFATAALVLGIPIFDAVWVVGRRLLTGQPVWKADKLHLHHRFLDAGLSPRATALTLYAVATLCAVVALNSGTAGKVAAIAALAAFMVLLGVVLVLSAGRRAKG
ncbi:undecaprenyl/decaprenyl-phosphate alpha-N-acetylglucosaminyl 1-phosphate transferase [Candidatus Berkelbacteria bacterium]|nr:undecaprenyl/decaprenyl-phosphate alpha-N-acetylglucosaminyl 1-phosphate transferase [Candidatus Berkelbacteria bacterium]